MGKKKILVLGSTGMLGSMILKYLSSNLKDQIVGTSRQKKIGQKNVNFFDADYFLINPQPFSFIKKFDFIINCIGIIKPYCQDDDPKGVINAIKINALFPHKLATFCSKSKIIQIATDCVYSGKEGNYNEDDKHDPLDVYGKTKSLGEVKQDNFLNIRCSIIGPELKRKINLLEWFLAQKNGSTIEGFTHHKWNGVTTLQFAKLVKEIIKKNKFNSLSKVSYIHHFILNNIITKYQLLKIFAKVYDKKITIKPVNNIGPKINRTLSTNYNTLSLLFKQTDIKSAVIEIKQHIDQERFYGTSLVPSY